MVRKGDTTVSLLRIWRESLGLTVERVADAAGVTGQTVHNWERGRGEPRPSQLAKLEELGPGAKKAFGL